jgi:amino acid permease
MSRVAASSKTSLQTNRDEAPQDVEELPVGALPVPPADKNHALHRGLSARQVSMIAIAGTIGTGLFLGTGRSLAQGGPASMLICYAIVGFIVYITLLLLGEMATQYPVAGDYLHRNKLSLSQQLTSFVVTRFFQRVRNALLFTLIWVCTVLELLV